MKFLQGLFILIATAVSIDGFVPEIQMPYKVISGTSIAEINKIGSTLTCDEQRNSLHDCATECFNKSMTTTGCPGFYTDTSQSNICHLCHVSNKVEVDSNSHSTFGSNDKLYLVKYKVATPKVSMDFDNYTETEIYGVNVVSTASGVELTDHTPGIKGEGLYLHGGGKVALTGSSTECWTNLDHCTSGMTVSIWYKTTTVSRYAIPVGSGVIGQKGFNLLSGDAVRFTVFTSIKTYVAQSAVRLSLNEWYLLTGVYDGNEHLDFYLNGIKGSSPSNDNQTSVDSDWGAHIGVRDAPPYTQHQVNGYVDEFKFYYRMLNSVEIWREYVGYDLDLDRPLVIPVPDLVSNSNDHTDLVDGNPATCVFLNQDSCTAALKVKLWNSVPDKTNFTVTIVTENMECHLLMVYGGQDLPDGLPETIPHEMLHFLGKRKQLQVESETVVNGQIECVFKPLCGGMYYDVVVSVQNTPDEGSWKICEIHFD